MWKIKQIFDGDFGCEEPAPGEKGTTTGNHRSFGHILPKEYFFT